MDGTDVDDVTITVEDDKEDKEGSLEEIQIAKPVNMKMMGRTED